MEGLRFACDAMLGSLARWLRFAGFDVFFAVGVDDDQLAELARLEGRWLLTRDRELASRTGPRVVLIEAANLKGEVAELRRRLPLGPRVARFLSRCSRCNGSLREVSRGEVVDLVPPFVAARAERFSRCEACGQIYWPGTHHARILRRLHVLFIDPLE